MLTLESLNRMAVEQPKEIALVEQGYSITFIQLERMISRRSQKLFDDGVEFHGQHIQNKVVQNIVGLCADKAGIHTMTTIPATLSGEELSIALKTANIQVLYTDVMDHLWEIKNLYGPSISMVSPIELFHSKIWKVEFREEVTNLPI